MSSTGILKKIAAIQEELGRVAKQGYDDRNDYNYFTAEDIVFAVSELMIKHGVINRVIIVQSEQGDFYDKSGRGRPRTSAVGRVDFIDIEDGSSFSTEVVATGSDIGGDKGPRKVHTMIKKIAFIDVFNIVDNDRAKDADDLPEQPGINNDEDTASAPAVEGQAPEKTPPREISVLAAEIGKIVNDKERPEYGGPEVKALGDMHSKSLGNPDGFDWRKNSPETLELILKSIKAGESA